MLFVNVWLIIFTIFVMEKTIQEEGLVDEYKRKEDQG
jgi:hypothetical protein